MKGVAPSAGLSRTHASGPVPPIDTRRTGATRGSVQGTPISHLRQIAARRPYGLDAPADRSLQATSCGVVQRHRLRRMRQVLWLHLGPVKLRALADRAIDLVGQFGRPQRIDRFGRHGEDHGRIRNRAEVRSRMTVATTASPVRAPVTVPAQRHDDGPSGPSLHMFNSLEAGARRAPVDPGKQKAQPVRAGLSACYC